MKDRLELDKGVVYEFSDEEEYQGKKFISLKKITTYKDNKKYQNLTIRPEHWDMFERWVLEECFNGQVSAKTPSKENINPIGDDRVPF